MTRFSSRMSPALPMLALACTLTLARTARAQQPNLNSHEVNPDHSVTFRYYAPNSKSVTLSLDYDHHPTPLKMGADGVWSLTTAPLQAAEHMYSLTVDGISVFDPFNSRVDANLNYVTNMVRVPGAMPELWEASGAPHGVLHHHVYATAVMRNLAGGLEDYYVYTPAGYDPAAAKTYPVLYLLHGWSETAASWTSSGQADLILDNLIAQGKALPMIVVMPQGYGNLEFTTKGFGQWDSNAAIAENLGLFGEGLLQEIIPQVESNYRVRRDRTSRAITGLSMGGGQSLIIGLNHPDLFAWIGGFSSGVTYASFDGLIPGLENPLSPMPSLLWIACGTSDDLFPANRKFVAWLKTKGLNPTAVETPGIHNWPVWRDDLVHFAPLLFREQAAKP